MEMTIKMYMLFGVGFTSKMTIPPDIGIPSYITNFDHEVTWILSSDEILEVKETTLDNINIFFVPFSQNISVNYILHILKRNNLVLKHFKQNKFNLIFVRRDVLDGLLALYIKKKYNIPFVFQMENPIEQTWETKKFYSKHKTTSFLSSKIREIVTIYLLNKAELVLPISESLEKDFINKGIPKTKIMPLPEGVLLSRFSNKTGEHIKIKYNLENSKVIVYVGNLDKLRCLDVLVYTIKFVKEYDSNIKLLLVGEGNDKENLQKLSRILGLENNIIFTGYVNYLDIPFFIAAADIGISPIPPTNFYKLSSPIKLFEYMAMAKPVVANEEIIEHKNVLESSGGGILVKFESSSFAEAVIKLLSNTSLAKEIGVKGYNWVAENRSYEVLANKLEGKFLELINN